MTAGDLAQQTEERHLVVPRLTPPLDPGFQPAALARQALEVAARAAGGPTVRLSVEQPGGSAFRMEMCVFPASHPAAVTGYESCERLVKSMLWSLGGSRVWVDGPGELVRFLRHHYESEATGRFDARMLGEEIYLRPFELVDAPEASFPTAGEGSSDLGRHLDGCRIGFDLGASDRKVAAVIDGKVVFSEERPWDPGNHADPAWHLEQIDDSLRRAAGHLPRVDAIGGSSAGVYVGNEVRVASLFRAVPRDVFASRIRNLFDELRRLWGGIPFVVVNDGEVTALAGAMLANVGGLLGIAMGSSEAAGYVTPAGRLTSRLNELAFSPIDAAPGAPVDEWSGDRGCGVQYFSQQAVGRLLAPAGIELEPGLSLPDRLVCVQELMAAGDDRARRIYETIGTYLGYALLDYRRLYEIEHVLLLGRVMTGEGGEIITSRARAALVAEAPEVAEAIRFHAVPERDKRHGQAVAAASLPALGR